MSPSRIETGPVSIAVQDWGGDGHPTLLAHATGFHGVTWKPVAERLVAAGRHVWSFDFRGQGESDSSPDGYSWEGFADDVLTVVDALGLSGNPELLGVGLSKGATALLLAQLHKPDAFGYLYCFEPIVFPFDAALPHPDANPLAAGALKRRAVWESTDQALASFGARPPLGVLHPDALRAYVEYGLRGMSDGSFSLKCAPEVEAAIYSMSLSHGAFGRLGEIAIPVAVVSGETTNALTPKFAALVADGLINGHLEVMPGLGHFGPLENPDTVVASILRFASEYRQGRKAL